MSAIQRNIRVRDLGRECCAALHLFGALLRNGYRAKGADCGQLSKVTCENGMNKKQQTILMVTAILVTAMLLFPPYTYRSVANTYSTGYGFIFDLSRNAAVNIPLLLTQWLGVLIVGAIAFLITKGSKTK